jgi:hypothetical protein
MFRSRKLKMFRSRMLTPSWSRTSSLARHGRGRPSADDRRGLPPLLAL